MRSFRQFFNHKASRKDFKTLYEAECHVCRYTMRIFEKVEMLEMDLDQLAADVQMDPGDLRKLRDADCCNPHQVIALCRHLDQEPPAACPRLEGFPEATPISEGS